jgi:hypothetical protein
MSSLNVRPSGVMPVRMVLMKLVTLDVLLSFLQDYWAHPASVTAAEEELVLATIETLPGISVAQLLTTHPLGGQLL